MVVNYVGDALIAAFNAPLPIEDYSARAVNTARDLLSLVSGRDFEGPRLRLRIGVATGSVAAGTVGGAERQTYTLYGDTVNLAQRLEQMNKELGTNCLICGTTLKSAGSNCADASPWVLSKCADANAPLRSFHLTEARRAVSKSRAMSPKSAGGCGMAPSNENVCFLHLADIAAQAPDVRFRAKSRHLRARR